MKQLIQTLRDHLNGDKSVHPFVEAVRSARSGDLTAFFLILFEGSPDFDMDDDTCYRVLQTRLDEMQDAEPARAAAEMRSAVRNSL